jgi:predicted nucleotidyltransferase
MPDSNRELLINAARLLRPLLDEVVFVGGSVTGLLITDSAAGDPRATRDVDAIAAITSYPAYVTFGERLRALGFAEDTSAGAPLCRWVNGTTMLDVMPLDEEILGFSNCWYQAAMVAAVRHQLTTDLVVRLVTAPYFIATKLEAFKGRGDGDFFSHDLEDLINVVDGRETLATEGHAENAALREYLRTESEGY